MKKILEIFGEPISRGGQESYVMSVLHYMDVSEMKIDFYTPYYCDNKNIRKSVEKMGGSVFSANLEFRPGKRRGDIIKVLKKHLNNNYYDLVHIHSGSTTVLAYCAMVATKMGVGKVIVHSHSSGVTKGIKHIIIKCYSAYFLKKYATDYCACSREAAKWKFTNSIMKKVRILNNGIDTSKYQYNEEKRKSMRQLYGIKKDTILLGHVGRFSTEKNQIFLIKLLKKLIDEGNDEVRLILVGDGKELEYVKKESKKSGMDNKIVFVGAVDNVQDYLQMMDIFVFPSIYEGLGIVGVEAQASGLPVFAATGVPESMKLRDNVSFIDLNNIEQWCREISEYKITPRLGAYKEIENKGFDIKDTSKKVYSMYMN